MQTIYLRSALILLMLAPLSVVNAHDPSKHAAQGEMPKCAAMSEMDHSKMDMNDPVMQAMMQKCKAGKHNEVEAAEKMSPDHHDAKAGDELIPELSNDGDSAVDDDD